MDSVTGIVIAGGKSSRMGTNKALVIYKDKKLIEHVISIIEPLVSQIVISSNTPLLPLQYKNIADKIKDIGPIGGLYSSLLASNTEVNLILPCDVPHIKTELLQQLIDNCKNVDAVIPRLPSGKLEPLVACYNKSIMPFIKKAINLGDYKLVNLLSIINVKYIDIAEVDQFKNVNTPGDVL